MDEQQVIEVSPAAISNGLKLMGVFNKLVAITSATYVCTEAALMPKLVVDGREPEVDALMGVFFGSQYEKRTLCFDVRTPDQVEAAIVTEEHSIVSNGRAMAISEEGSVIFFGDSVPYLIVVLPYNRCSLYLGGTTAQLVELAEQVTLKLGPMQAGESLKQ